MAKNQEKAEKAVAAAESAAHEPATRRTSARRAKKALGRLEAKLARARESVEKRQRRLDEAVAAVRTLEARVAEFAGTADPGGSHSPSDEPEAPSA